MLSRWIENGSVVAWCVFLSVRIGDSFGMTQWSSVFGHPFVICLLKYVRYDEVLVAVERVSFGEASMLKSWKGTVRLQFEI